MAGERITPRKLLEQLAVERQTIEGKLHKRLPAIQDQHFLAGQWDFIDVWEERIKQALQNMDAEED